MAACAKHFPGDGVDFRDQHLHPTYNSLPAAQGYATYGAIYRELIGRGLMSVMVGHIVRPAVAMEINPALRMEDCLPASLSPELLTGLLRGKLGFNGVITSDATIMGGYCMAMERSKAIPASIAAGCGVEVYKPLEDELHGTSALSGRRLTLYLANYEQASNQTTVRIDWCKKHALDTPRFLNEEPCVFVSLANPYLLQDVPRVPTYINAYTASRAVIEAVIGKLLRGGPFEGVSPVDAFCGLPDTRL